VATGFPLRYPQGVTLDDLRDELELACAQVMDGAPAGALQASRVRRCIGDVLRRRGLSAQVEVLAGGQAARVVLRPRGPKVQQVVIRIGPM